MVLTKGRDGKYGGGNDNLTAALASYNLAGKTQAQILDILEDATIGAAGSDDLMWTGYINVIPRPYLNASISKSTVSPGDNFEVYGNASSDYVEIVAISPRGGNGAGMEGLYGVSIYTVPIYISANALSNNEVGMEEGHPSNSFYKKIKVDGVADAGNYTLLVLSREMDDVYGNSSYKYIDSILDLDGAGPELGAIDVSNKTKAEIIRTIENATINQVGTDDLLWTGHLTVFQPDVYVDDDFEDDPANHRWNTIQEGVNNANEGDVVYVYAGDYNENVIVNKSITLQEEDRDNTIIDGNRNGDVVNVTADNCMIDEFTMQNGNYGIKIFKSSNNTVTGNNASSNNFDGVDLQWSNNNTITNNIAYYNSIGIHSCHSNNNIISNNILNLTL